MKPRRLTLCEMSAVLGKLAYIGIGGDGTCARQLARNCLAGLPSLAVCGSHRRCVARSDDEFVRDLENVRVYFSPVCE